MTYNEQLLRVPIPLKSMDFATGTWAYTTTGNKHHMLKTAADTTSIISMTIPAPRRQDMYGMQLDSIIIPASVATANLDAVPSLLLYRQEYDAVDVTASATSLVAAVNVPVTAGAGCVVTADADDRLWKFDVTTPAPDFSLETLAFYLAELTINAAAGSVVKIYTPIAVYRNIG